VLRINSVLLVLVLACQVLVLVLVLGQLVLVLVLVLEPHVLLLLLVLVLVEYLIEDWYIKPMTHLKATFERKLLDVAQTCTSFYFQKSTFTNRTSSTTESFRSHYGEL